MLVANAEIGLAFFYSLCLVADVGGHQLLDKYLRGMPVVV